MSDNSSPPKSPARSIPSWQRAQVDKPPATSESPSDPTAQKKGGSTAAEPDEKDMTVSERAVKWLEDPSIQNASRERKVAFLLSKGVAKDDIDRLLPPKQSQPPTQAADVPKVVHSSSGEEKTVKIQSPQSSQPQPQPPPSDTPPIITYPEFLLHSQEKPPLVTTQRLVNTAYLAGGTMATLYGLSKYVIAPMASSLSMARHEFWTHSAAQVDELNTRLEKTVSSVPTAHATQSKIADDDDPPSPTDSDPTELFHRDIGIQTEPELAREISATDTSNTEDGAADTTSRQESKLKSINAQLAELRTSSDDHTDGSLSELKSTVLDLTTYLTDMSYSSPYYGYGYGGIDGRGVGNGLSFGAAGAGDNKDKGDAVDAMKAEIRGVKGVLLSARNFPGTRPMATGR